jgi:hypothetical protein
MATPHNQSILPLEAQPSSLWLRPLIAAWARIQIGELRLTAPDGSKYLFRGQQSGPVATLRLRSPRLRLALRHELGLAESHMAGEWDSPELATLLELGALNQPHLQVLMVGRTWFRTLDRLRHVLRPNTRKAGRRNIRARYDLGNRFYQLYIFPGGLLPAPGVFFDHARAAGLEVRSRSFHGQDYAETLAQWERRFLAARKQVNEQGFDRRFQRTWRYYLAYCQAGFRTRRIDLMRTVLQRPANGGYSCAPD